MFRARAPARLEVTPARLRNLRLPDRGTLGAWGLALPKLIEQRDEGSIAERRRIAGDRCAGDGLVTAGGVQGEIEPNESSSAR